MRVLTRYLLRAHIGPFLFAFVALTGVILINTLAKELANLAGKGLPFSVVTEFFMLSLPANIALTLPMAVLVSVLYTFSSLASENEITALRASGVDLRRAAMPLLVAAALIAGGMVWFSDQVLPAANYRWRVLMTDVAAARPLLALREQAINPIPTTDGRTPYYLEAQQIDAETGRMEDVTIYDVSNSLVTRTITADSGRMVLNSSRTDLLLTLFDGSIREVDFGELDAYQTFNFEQQVMRMEGVSDRLERSAESTFRTDRDMTLAMMRERIGSLRSELEQLRTNRQSPLASDENSDPASAIEDATHPPATDSSAAAAAANLGAAESEPAREMMQQAAPVSETTAAATRDTVAGMAAEDTLAATEDTVLPAGVEMEVPPEGLQAESRARETLNRYAETRGRNIESQIREFQVEIQKKFAIPVATLVFVLIGIPIALRFPSGGIGMVIGVSLAIFGVYYVGLIGGETLGDGGYVPPWVAMWITNVIFGGLGIVGFIKLGKEQGTGRGGGGLGGLPKWLRLRRVRTPRSEAA